MAWAKLIKDLFPPCFAVREMEAAGPRRLRFFSHFQSDRKLPIPIHFVPRSSSRPSKQRARRNGRAGTSRGGASKDDDGGGAASTSIVRTHAGAGEGRAPKNP